MDQAVSDLLRLLVADGDLADLSDHLRDRVVAGGQRLVALGAKRGHCLAPGMCDLRRMRVVRGLEVVNVLLLGGGDLLLELAVRPRDRLHGLRFRLGDVLDGVIALRVEVRDDLGRGAAELCRGAACILLELRAGVAARLMDVGDRIPEAAGDLRGGVVGNVEGGLVLGLRGFCSRPGRPGLAQADVPSPLGLVTDLGLGALGGGTGSRVQVGGMCVAELAGPLLSRTHAVGQAHRRRRLPGLDRLALRLRVGADTRMRLQHVAGQASSCALRTGAYLRHMLVRRCGDLLVLTGDVCIDIGALLREQRRELGALRLGAGLDLVFDRRSGFRRGLLGGADRDIEIFARPGCSGETLRVGRRRVRGRSLRPSGMGMRRHRRFTAAAMTVASGGGKGSARNMRHGRTGASMSAGVWCAGRRACFGTMLTRDGMRRSRIGARECRYGRRCWGGAGDRCGGQRRHPSNRGARGRVSARARFCGLTWRTVWRRDRIEAAGHHRGGIPVRRSHFSWIVALRVAGIGSREIVRARRCGRCRLVHMGARRALGAR